MGPTLAFFLASLLPTDGGLTAAPASGPEPAAPSVPGAEDRAGRLILGLNANFPGARFRLLGDGTRARPLTVFLPVGPLVSVMVGVAYPIEPAGRSSSP